ncbi:hypothetical protein O181_025468 [Austropuccinia psidii MF-1]|uniref:Uncharacterized protein n=1 Tax=Austropuccinia psidii MF-1 TaxID=1389203 RepID=A0A9Q3GZ51_9BASI|nr:hypothetical protein [Austropuccinia psidii MF-1]
MPVQHPPPSRQTRSQARAQAFLPPAPRVPFDGTPEVPQMRAQLDSVPHLEGEAPYTKEGRGQIRSISFSGLVGGSPRLSRTTFKGPG